jgi:hypothetical protein
MCHVQAHVAVTLDFSRVIVDKLRSESASACSLNVNHGGMFQVVDDAWCSETWLEQIEYALSLTADLFMKRALSSPSTQLGSLLECIMIITELPLPTFVFILRHVIQKEAAVHAAFCVSPLPEQSAVRAYTERTVKEQTSRNTRI